MTMKYLLAALLALSSQYALADAKALATSNNCMGCHAADKKMVGPSFKEIAARYKGNDSAPLVKKVKAGGSGAWGSVPMPASLASEADIKVIVDWIMAH